MPKSLSSRRKNKQAKDDQPATTAASTQELSSASQENTASLTRITRNQSDRILPEQLGLSVLYAPDLEDPTIDVVAVHGIGANPDRTWTTNKVNWLEHRDMLPRAIPTARIMRFGYDSQWFGEYPIKQRLSTVAEELLSCLREERKVTHVPTKFHIRSLINIEYRTATNAPLF